MSFKHIMENESTWLDWTSAILGSFLVGTSGIIPLVLIPAQKLQSDDKNSKEDSVANNKSLNRQLSFAVGGLLGDVFLHLLPESYEHGM